MHYKHYLPMQYVRPAYIQLVTGFGLKWGEKKRQTVANHN